jgi:hypothetical protein
MENGIKRQQGNGKKGTGHRRNNSQFGSVQPGDEQSSDSYDAHNEQIQHLIQTHNPLDAEHTQKLLKSMNLLDKEKEIIIDSLDSDQIIDNLPSQHHSSSNTLHVSYLDARVISSLQLSDRQF